MAKEINADIKENTLLKLDSSLLSILLKDNSSGKNILWATDDYVQYNAMFTKDKHMSVLSVTGKNSLLIRPRIEKTKQERLSRIRDKAEVFTPSWICNKQNNLVDNAWFERENVFNVEVDNPDGSYSWIPTEGKIVFPEGKTWYDYISENRLEITCGEAPYLVSRYNSVTGEPIPIERRIGILDRKLRVVGENTQTSSEWLKAAQSAYMSIYGYEWQGDNLVLARESLLYTFIDYYKAKFGKKPQLKSLQYIASIISWNIWQMDGLKGVIPESCHSVQQTVQSLFDSNITVQECEGCQKGNILKHNGTYCKIKDWSSNKTLTFVSLLKKGK